VYGREGSQAVAAGDFAVDRFECLRRLLLVHGAWCFTRTSELILYTFMHNCSYVFVIFYHQLFNGFSGAVTLHSLYLTLYSSLFTVLPQCAAALFDQHVPAERALYEPQLYEYTLHARCYRMWSYWVNIIDAVWQSTVIFFMGYFAYRNESYMDVSSFGFSMAFCMIITSLIHVLLQTSRIDWSIIASIAFSLLVFLGFTLIFDATCIQCIPGESPYKVSYETFRQGRFWFASILTIVTAMIPRFIVKSIYNTIRNPLIKTNITQDVEEDDDDVENVPSTTSFQAKFALLGSDDDNEAGDNDDNDEDTTVVKPTSTSTSSKKKSTTKKKPHSSKTKKEDEDIDSLLAAIESTSVSTKKSGNKKNKQATTTTTISNIDEENFKEGEGQDLEDILKEIDEKFDEKDRRKEAKKEKKKKKKEENKEVTTEIKSNENEGFEEKSTNQNENVSATIQSEIKEDELAAAIGGTDDKKTSSKNKKKGVAEKKGKGGVDAKTLSLMKEFQKKQEEAKLKALKDEEEKLRLEEELDKQHEEKIRLEKERREKKKQKEKERIQRKKEEGSYLTKEQREKRERARIQLEAAGIQVPARNTAQGTPNNGEQPVKKRVLYDDRRKKTQTNAKQADNAEPTTVKSQAAKTSTATKKLSAKEEENLKDNWEQESEEETTVNPEEPESPSTENDRNNFQHTVSIPSATTITNEENNESSEAESSDEETSSDESDETSSSSDDDENDQLTPMERVRRRLRRRHETCESRRSTEVLRAPVICVLGHVDTGKTKILDNLRRTHVQDGEAGGITQQIGATNVPLETLRERTRMCRKLVTREGEYIVPGLLIIDTPGHESFKNLRSRGSSLCDLAILVVDLMHGLEPQTLESIQLLMERKTPFIIALNKIDRLYSWKGDNKKNVELVLQEQSQNTRNEFEKRCNDIVVQFAEQGLNVALYYKNPDPNEFYSMVPTSAITGDGMGSLIAMIIERCQTSLAKRLSYTDELQATVMEVKAIGGLGTTIDVVLVNGHLRVGDTIIVAGQEGPIVTQIRGLLMPEPNRELRVRNQYQNYKTVKAARGIKIAAKDLEKSMAGLPLFVGRRDDETEYFKNEIQNILKTALSSIKLKENGVHVQASTLGSLEALLEFLKTSNIPYAGINIGPVHRKDIIRASTQLERDPQWAVILAFDVRIERDAQEHADTVGVKIFQADIIYHLFDMFIAHRERIKKENQEKYRHLAVFPCKLRVLPQYIFNSRDPIICGVLIEDGFVKLGTPICVPSKEFIELGRIVSIELNHKPLDVARKGSEVCIKIEPISGEAPKMFGRHFDENDLLMSKISRESIDIVKDHFRDDMQKSDWQLMIELKKIFNIL
ncbi:unnamed protein product, partial [Rotaria sp. Silwood1]